MNTEKVSGLLKFKNSAPKKNVEIYEFLKCTNFKRKIL